MNIRPGRGLLEPSHVSPRRPSTLRYLSGTDTRSLQSYFTRMVHAYLAILTGNGEDEDEEAEGYDGAHGPHFRTVHTRG